MLPASTCVRSGAGIDGEGLGRPARNLSTIAAISSRPILAVEPAATGAGTETGICGAAALVVAVITAGRESLTGWVSKPSRWISTNGTAETLSNVTLPPHTPQPTSTDG